MQYDGPAQLKALLFDHDGTLVDSEVVHYQFWAQVLAEYQLPFTEDDYRLHYVGVCETRTAADILQRFNVPANVDTLVARKRAIATAFHAQQHYPLMPAVADILAWLADQPLTLAVVSGSARFALEASLQALQLRSLFACIASGEEVPRNKPAPDVYQRAMAVLNLAPEACIALEDTRAGMLAAKAAGVFTCVIPNRYSAHQDFTEADRRFDAMADCLAWLKHFPGARPSVVGR